MIINDRLGSTLFQPCFIGPRDFPEHPLRDTHETIGCGRRIRWVGGDHGMPFGRIGWLVLLYLTTVAVKERSRHIVMTEDVVKFVRGLGGAYEHQYEDVTEQLLAISSALLSITHENARTLGTLIESLDIKPIQKEVRSVVLSTSFYEEVLRNHLVLDRRILMLFCLTADWSEERVTADEDETDIVAIGERQLQADRDVGNAVETYMWLETRMGMLRGTGSSGIFIAWKDVLSHFGIVANASAFQKLFVESLKTLRGFYLPGSVEVVEDRGIALSPFGLRAVPRS